MADYSRQVGVTFATEDVKMIIGGHSPKKGMVRGGGSNRLGGQNVKKRCRRGEGLNPIGGGHGRLKQQGANDIIDGANNAFGFTVLGRGVGARHAKVNALGEEKVTGARVVKLFPVIALNRLDVGAKLSGGVGDEVSERAESVRFKAQGESPQIVSAIIKYDQIIFVTGNTDN